MVELGRAVGKAYLSAISGRLLDAQSLVQHIRASVEFLQSPLLVAEVMLVEGVIAVYTGNLSYAKSRLDRVVAFADSAASVELASLARGWLALLSYNDGSVVDSARHALRALGCGTRPSSRTRLRLSTILSLLCAYAGQDSHARTWLLAARIAASELGAQGALSSVIFDLAVATLDRCYFSKLSGFLGAAEARQALIQVKSAMSYDAGAAVDVQRSLHALALGTALNLNRQFTEAREVVLEFLDSELVSRPGDRICGKTELAVSLLGVDPLPIDDRMDSELWAGLGVLSDPTERAAILSVLIESENRKDASSRLAMLKSMFDDEIGRRQTLAVSLEELLVRSQGLNPPCDWVRVAG